MDAGSHADAERPALERSVVHSLLGQVAPGLAALVAMPVLLHGFGTERLGLLHLTWLLVGYFSVLDIGIGRALTHAVAAALARRDPHGIGGLALAGYVMLGALGIAGAALLAAFAPWLAWSGLSMQAGLRPEAALAFELLAVAIPFVTVAAGARGVLEAQQRFDLVNAVRVPSGVLTYAAPALVLPFSTTVLPAVAATVVVRAATAVAYVWLGWRFQPAPRRTWHWSPRAFQGLLSIGAWIAVANISGTLTQYADRWVVGSFVSLAAVAYYATPLEVVSRLTILATAVMAVMFPAFSAEHVTLGNRLGSLYGKTLVYTLAALFPPVLAIVAFAPELLAWWLGADFARAGVATTRLIAAGTLANALAQAPFALLQATGRARVTAVLAAAELPAYAAALWVLTRAWGVEGVAVAWAGRMAVDALLHLALARRSLRDAGSERAFAAACAVGVAALVAVSAAPGLHLRAAVALAGGAAFAGVVAWAIGPANLAARLRALRAR